MVLVVFGRGILSCTLLLAAQYVQYAYNANAGYTGNPGSVAC